MQLQHALATKGLDWAEVPDISPIESAVLMGELGHKPVSYICHTHINNKPDNLPRLWKGDLGPLEDIDWEAALMHPREVRIKARLRTI